jgi:hypothetical protein
MRDVIKWGQAIGIGRFDDAIKYRTGIGTAFCVAEQPDGMTFNCNSTNIGCFEEVL